MIAFSFIIAGVVVIVTVALVWLQLFAEGYSDAPGVRVWIAKTLCVGFLIAALVAASHWLPWLTW